MEKREREQIANVLITDMSSEGKGISKINGRVIFTEGAVPGDEVEIEVLRKKRNYAEARIVTIHKPSELRATPACKHFGTCGGCKWQQVQYAEQLRFKAQTVRDAFTRIGKLEYPEPLPIKGCTHEYDYRNKLEFTFTNRRWLMEEELQSEEVFGRDGVGFHIANHFMSVLDVEHCHLQEVSNQVRLGVKKFALENGYTFFNLKTQEGLLRTLLVRSSSLSELLVLLSFYEDDSEKIERLMNHLAESFPQITSLQYVINSKKNDTIYDLENKVFKGQEYIMEQLGDYQFKIHPKSFFQTNIHQTKVLYDVVKDFAGIQKSDVVYDLYTGVGSIAIYLSALAKEVIGIEQIEAAIIDAKENSRLNNVQNTKFYAGDVKKLLTPDFITENGSPDVLITDPPRAGMHEDVVRTLLTLSCPKIVYVSCNPASQARDLQLLAELYNIVKVQPVDMFPHTTHIENVVLLEKKL